MRPGKDSDFFFFNDTATTEIYTLSLHDALPISHVPEHTELYWVLNTVTPLGELERQTQFKDKAQRQESVPAGLLHHPLLQAADVLLYEANLVPAGEEPLQHLQPLRQIARPWDTP